MRLSSFFLGLFLLTLVSAIEPKLVEEFPTIYINPYFWIYSIEKPERPVVEIVAEPKPRHETLPRPVIIDEATLCDYVVKDIDVFQL